MGLSSTPLRVRPTRRLDLLCASGPLPNLQKSACRSMYAGGRVGAAAITSIKRPSSPAHAFSSLPHNNSSSHSPTVASSVSFNPTGCARSESSAPPGSPAPPRSAATRRTGSRSTSHTIAPRFFSGGARTFVTLSTSSSCWLSTLTSSSAPLASSGRLQPGSPRHFSTTPAAMVALKLDGTAIAKAIRERLGSEIAARQKLNPRYKPSLKIVQGTSRRLLF